MLKHLDLFSGIGGFSLGLESAGLVKTVAFCDFDNYCQKVLKKNFPSVPVYGDIKELNYDRLKADGIDKIDIITGGYPCQPFSVAGRKKGEEDPRHVWPEYFRLIKELRPTWVIGENVGGHIKLGLDSVLENLESEGYTARTFSISASSIGANHQRERVWIIAHSNEFGRNDRGDHREERQFQNDQERNIEESKSEGERWFDRVGKISAAMENPRCELWPWTFEREENENEIGEEDANQFERSSSTSSTNVADSNSDGFERQLSQVSDEINAGENSSEFGGKSSDKIIRQSNDGGDTKKSRLNEGVSRSSDAREGEFTSSRRVRELSSQSNDNQRISEQDKHKENNDRTLVQEGQSRIQSPEYRGLEHDKNIFQGSKIRQGNDNTNKQRMDNVANTNRKRLEGSINEKFSTTERSEDVANTEGGDWNEHEINGEHGEATSQEIFGDGSSLPREGTWWAIEPNVGRVAHGVPQRVDRLKCLGNSVVPQIPYLIGLAIKETIEHE